MQCLYPSADENQTQRNKIFDWKEKKLKILLQKYHLTPYPMMNMSIGDNNFHSPLVNEADVINSD